MGKKYKIIIGIFILIIALSNVFSGMINLVVLGVGHVYTYETYDGKYKFNYNPHKGGSIERLCLRYQQLQKDETVYADTSLVRTFKRKPLHFWNWYAYVFSEEYKFQYQESSKSSIHYQGLYEK